MVVMYIEKVPNRNSPPPFFDLIPIEKEIKSKKEPWPTSQNYPMILSTIWNWLLKGRYNRDKKKGKTQIVFGLLCSAKGCPIAGEVFEGNTSDSATLARQIEKVRKGWGIENVVWVSDRGILTKEKINELVKPIKGLDYITFGLYWRTWGRFAWIQ